MYWVRKILRPPTDYVLHSGAIALFLLLLISSGRTQTDDAAFNATDSLDYKNATKVRLVVPQPADPCKAGKW